MFHKYTLIIKKKKTTTTKQKQTLKNTKQNKQTATLLTRETVAITDQKSFGPSLKYQIQNIW